MRWWPPNGSTKGDYSDPPARAGWSSYRLWNKLGLADVAKVSRPDGRAKEEQKHREPGLGSSAGGARVLCCRFVVDIGNQYRNYVSGNDEVYRFCWPLVG